MFLSDVRDKSYQRSISIFPLWATDINQVNNQIYIRSYMNTACYLLTHQHKHSLHVHLCADDQRPSCSENGVVLHSEFWPVVRPSRETRTRWLTDPRSPERPAREIYGRPSPRCSTSTISLTAFFSRYIVLSPFVTNCWSVIAFKGVSFPKITVYSS